MTSKNMVLLVVVGVAIASVVLAQTSKKGAPEITLKGGNRGDVHFPHRTHQDTLVDCMICHEIFPQIPGIIEDLKGKEKLEKKQVMNHCRGCHQNRISAGKKAGPTACNKCHAK
jgi:hypothetical protein